MAGLRSALRNLSGPNLRPSVSWDMTRMASEPSSPQPVSTPVELVPAPQWRSNSHISTAALQAAYARRATGTLDFGSSSSQASLPLLGFKAQLVYLQDLSRRRAVWLIAAAVICGFLGFMFAAILGFEDIFLDETTNYRGERFASGRPYFPATVSEMVRDPESASGKCFFAFEFMGAICLLMSWYPWELSNVYIGHHNKTVFGISWLSVRQFLPPLGMMVVACVTTTPWPQADASDKVTIFIHCGGAMAMFGSHILCEIHTLSIRGPQHSYIGPRERWLRWLTTLSCGLMMAGFCLFQLLLMLTTVAGICCDDVYRVPTLEDIEYVRQTQRTPYDYHHLTYLAAQRKAQLFDTANGPVFWFKLLSYVSEVLQGTCLLTNLLIIWWFCPERHIVLDAELPWAEASEDSDSDVSSMHSSAALARSKAHTPV